VFNLSFGVLGNSKIVAKQEARKDKKSNSEKSSTKTKGDVVPFIGEMTLEQATDMVRAGFPSRLNGGKHAAEGVVGRPLEALFDKKGHRLIVKLKTKDF